MYRGKILLGPPHEFVYVSIFYRGVHSVRGRSDSVIARFLFILMLLIDYLAIFS